MSWKAVCCAVQGKGHIKADVPCQDMVRCLRRNGVCVIALADGAGSAEFSHYGAECVVHKAADYLAERFEALFTAEDGRQTKLELLELLMKALSAKASELGCAVNKLASTFLAAAVSGDRYIAVHIGDGVIGYLKNGELKVASAPNNGEFANVTTFVTSREAAAAMRLFRGEQSGIDGFVLMSDGTEQSLYHKPTKSLGRAIIRLMQQTCLISGEVMESQLNIAMKTVVSQQTQDDCSIAILARPSGQLCTLESLSFDSRRSLYRINAEGRRLKRRVKKYDSILALLNTPHTLRHISRIIHLNPKHTKRRLDNLIEIGLIAKENERYSRV